MKIDASGKKTLQLWVAIGETFFYLILYELIKSLNLFGLLICLALYGIRLYEIVASKRDVFHRFQQTRKRNEAFVAFLLLVLIAMDAGSLSHFGWVMFLGAGFYLSGTYAINLYSWYMRWDYLTDMSHAKDKRQLLQYSVGLGEMERLNARWVGLKLFPAALLSGTVCYLLWISPVFHWIRELLRMVFLAAVAFIANNVLGRIPKSFIQAAQNTKDDAGPKDAFENFLKQAKESAGRPDFQSGYDYIYIAIVVMTIVAIAYLARKALMQKKDSGAKPSFIEKPFEVIKNWIQPEGRLEQAKSHRKHPAPDALLRKKYLQLLKRLKKRGLSITATDTADQLKEKLAIVYPNQDALIDIITEAYCVRRYAEREPENIHEVLDAFQLLKEVSSHETRKRSTET